MSHHHHNTPYYPLLRQSSKDISTNRYLSKENGERCEMCVRAAYIYIGIYLCKVFSTWLFALCYNPGLNVCLHRKNDRNRALYNNNKHTPKKNEHRYAKRIYVRLRTHPLFVDVAGKIKNIGPLKDMGFLCFHHAPPRQNQLSIVG